MKRTKRNIAQIDDYQIGGKARGLVFLKENNVLVPEFYVFDFSWINDARNASVGFDGAFFHQRNIGTNPNS